MTSQNDLIDYLTERTGTDPYKLKRLSKPELEKLLSTIKETEELAEAQREKIDNISNNEADLLEILRRKDEIIQVSKNMKKVLDDQKETSTEVYKSIIDFIGKDFSKRNLKLHKEIDGHIEDKVKLQQEVAQDYVEMNYMKSQVKRGYIFIALLVIATSLIVFLK